MKRTIAIIFFLPAIIGAIWFWSHREITVKKSLFAMGTVFEITATGSKPVQVIDEAFSEIKRIESLTSNQAGSELIEVNRAAGVKPVKISPEFMTILKEIAATFVDLSGSFDPTIAPIVDLWGFNPQGKPHLPDPKAISRVLPLVGFGRLKLNLKEQTVFLPDKGMKLDLGGIAKGYAVDRAYLTLRKAGIRSALINGGSSSIRVLGKRSNGEDWRLGIGHPRRAGELLGTLGLPKNRALGTSADNQNFFFHQGIRYSHLIDPRSGYPTHDKILVTVTAPTAMKADLLSTAFFVMPIPDIKTFLSVHPEYEAVIFNASGELSNLGEATFRAE